MKRLLPLLLAGCSVAPVASDRSLVPLAQARAPTLVSVSVSNAYYETLPIAEAKDSSCSNEPLTPAGFILQQNQSQTMMGTISWPCTGSVIRALEYSDASWTCEWHVGHVAGSVALNVVNFIQGRHVTCSTVFLGGQSWALTYSASGSKLPHGVAERESNSLSYR